MVAGERQSALAVERPADEARLIDRAAAVIGQVEFTRADFERSFGVGRIHDGAGRGDFRVDIDGQRSRIVIEHDVRLVADERRAAGRGGKDSIRVDRTLAHVVKAR